MSNSNLPQEQVEQEENAISVADLGKFLPKEVLRGLEKDLELTTSFTKKSGSRFNLELKVPGMLIVGVGILLYYLK